MDIRVGMFVGRARVETEWVYEEGEEVICMMGVREGEEF